MLISHSNVCLCMYVNLSNLYSCMWCGSARLREYPLPLLYFTLGSASFFFFLHVCGKRQEKKSNIEDISYFSENTHEHLIITLSTETKKKKRCSKLISELKVQLHWSPPLTSTTKKKKRRRARSNLEARHDPCLRHA